MSPFEYSMNDAITHALIAAGFERDPGTNTWSRNRSVEKTLMPKPYDLEFLQKLARENTALFVEAVKEMTRPATKDEQIQEVEDLFNKMCKAMMESDTLQLEAAAEEKIKQLVHEAVTKELQLHREKTVEANLILSKRITAAVQDIREAREAFGNQVHNLATQYGELIRRISKLEQAGQDVARPSSPVNETPPAGLTGEELDTLRMAVSWAAFADVRGMTDAATTGRELEAIIKRHTI